MVQTVSTGNRGINIPPHADDYVREGTMTPYKHPADGLVVLAAHARPRQSVLVRSHLP